MKAVHAGKVKPGHIDVELMSEFTRMFRNSLFEGYGKSFADVDYDTPDYYSLQYLKNNLHAFGAAKTMDEIKAMSELLTDAGGKRRDWQSFKQEALKLHHDYNVNWLRTEYDTAFANAQMARQWNDYQRNDYYTSITIRTAMDERVRDTHAAYEGFTRPKNDPIWSTLWPPFDWNCRCDTEESDTPIYGSVDVQEIPTMFRNNSGMSGVAFDSSHPYFKNMKSESAVSARVQAIAITELTAVGNYRMDTAASLLKKANTAMPQDDMRDWLVLPSFKDGMKTITDNGRSVVVITQEQGISAAILAVTTADEQWIGHAGARTYIKYYSDGIMAVRCDKKGVCTSVKVLNAEKAEGLRKGVLVV